MLFDPSDRSYSDNIIITSKTINPINEKLLVGDTIYEEQIIYTSKYRKLNSIPGILVYSGQSYGRNKHKMLYKCIPYDKKLPIFLIPYEQKKNDFNKVKINKFILFKFVEWINKHPTGMITNTLGDVNNNNVYCDYQIYGKGIHFPIQNLTKSVNKKMLNYKNNSFYSNNSNSEIRHNKEVITIDPQGSLDYDDALSVCANSNETVVSIYISNVPMVLDKLNLWSELTERASTIYLPNGKKPMLPSILGDNICSLLENTNKYVIAMDIYITNDGLIRTIEYKNCLVSITKNYVYEEDELQNNVTYNVLKKKAIELNKSRQYINNVVDSHDVVAFYMILMNHEVGKMLASNKNGIFRDVKYYNKELKENQVPEILRKYVTIYNNVNASYKLYNENNTHELIGKGIDYYAQTTSPIRRIIDLINIILLQKYNNICNVSGEIDEFVATWLLRIDNINNNMKAIRRVEHDCIILKACIENSKIINDGYILDYNYDYDNYSIYIPSIKLTTFVKCGKQLLKYHKYKVSLHIFNDEYTLRKKVRVQIIL
tara:strand:+ start:6601 stop:8229 length:1629 start_codon:yes stop_codon:yes gene_type:complete